MSNNSLSVLFMGDACFKYQHDLDYAASVKILADMMPVIRSADLRVMNLETPLAPEGVGAPIPKSGPNIIGRPQNIGFVEAAGCECVSLANNHTGDYGDDALFYTLKLLDEHGIGHTGAGANLEEAYKAWRCEKNGVRLSIIAVCENEYGLAGRESAGTAAFCFERLSDEIRKEREVSDFVVIFPHGGCEHNPLPSPKARERYRMMLRLGADAVVATHTHCPQGWEYYDGKPIVYSMGNFLFKYENTRSVPWFCGYTAELTFQAGERTRLTVTPYRFDQNGTRIERLRGEDLSKMMDYLENLSEILLDGALLEKYYDGWCMHSGLSYIQRMCWNPEWAETGIPHKDSGFRNLLTCDAHAELMATTARILLEGRRDEAMKWKEKILALQTLPVGALETDG